jgi:hypothetical protein
VKARGLLCLFAALVLPSGSAFAHEDTVLELHGTTLVGLPAEYSPAELDLKARRLRIKDHEMKISALLESFFDEPYDLQVYGSWYHERDILPPYIGLHIQPKKRDYGFKILLELRTLRLIQATVVLRRESGTTQYLPIALEDFQKKLIRESVRIVR